MSDARPVTGAELIKRVKRIGKRRGVASAFVRERGKGSHGTLYFGDRRTTAKHRQAELGKGLLHAMLRQLGLTVDDLEK
jgi:mRNA interferase HicA